MPQLLSPRESGHNFGKPELNSAGIVYSIFIIAYTVLLICGLVLLWQYRGHTAIRIRGFLITSAAVLSIHVYVAALFIVYPLNGWYKCGTEFWYMSIVFPLGVALFQASNVRLMSYARTQHDLYELKCWAEKKQPFSWKPRDLHQWSNRLNYVKKTYLYIAIGLLVQTIITFVLFFGSRRFSPGLGFFGSHVGPGECRRGAEWIPSVLWQFLWTWVLGPYVLFKTRHIKDTHYWALQTRLAVIAGLPGTPLWLAFLYSGSSKLDQLNAWWPPAMWFGPGLIVMQITSIFLPLYDMWRHRPTKRPSSAHSTISDASTLNSRASTSCRKSKELANSFEAFEFQLRHNIRPLLWFAATRDFTGENIQFLREVRDFKRKWRRHLACPPAGGLVLTSTEQRSMYEDAARIYFELVCPNTSRCYINVDSKIYHSLEEMFKNLDYEPPMHPTRRTHSQSTKRSDKNHKDEVVAPWDSPVLAAISRPGTSTSSRESETALIDIGLDNLEEITVPPPTAGNMTAERTPTGTSNIWDEAPESITRAPTTPLSRTSTANSPGDIIWPAQRGRITIRTLISTTETSTHPASSVPETFSLRVFDKAEESIKYLVYTNTWKSFINALDPDTLTSLTLDASSHRNSTTPADHAPRKTRHHTTDVELYALDGDLEMQAAVDEAEAEADALHAEAARDSDTPRTALGQRSYRGSWTPTTHNGVLDQRPAPLHRIDSRCASCRRKAEARNGNGAEKVGIEEEVMELEEDGV